MKKIFLTENIHKNAVAFLKNHVEVIQGTSTKAEDIIAQAQGCHGMLIRSVQINEEIIEKIPTLQVIGKHGIGVDNIDVNYATQKGVLVVNAPFSNVNAVAEHALALILSIAKNIPLLHKTTCDGGFSMRTSYVNVELAGKTVGLIGLGKISKLLALKLSNMGVNVIAFDPYVKQEDADILEVKMVLLSELLQLSDFVSLHVPLNVETQMMVNDTFLSQMKKAAYLINVSRGGIVDERALVEALSNNRIAGAALDVFFKEPPEKNNPLFKMDNVIVSPHNAALTDNALLAMAMDSAMGIVDYLEEKVPEFQVNSELLKV